MKDTNRKNLFTTIAIGNHVSCLAVGAYKGVMDEKGTHLEIPFRYLWATNTVWSGGANYEMAKRDGKITNSTDTALSLGRGAFFGAVLAPIEFTAGYVLGYGVSWFSDKVFS